MKKTIVLNLFGGPGAGKSTGACYVFSQLKLRGIDCEYVSEFAKDKVWEHNEEVLKCQFYISGKQSYKISRVYGKVDVIITDSPILTGAVYGDYDNPKLVDAIVYEFNKYRNHNVFIKRVKPYNPNGRMQTESGALEKDMMLKNTLNKYKIEYHEIDGDEGGYDEVVDNILRLMDDVKEESNNIYDPNWTTNFTVSDVDGNVLEKMELVANPADINWVPAPEYTPLTDEWFLENGFVRLESEYSLIYRYKVDESKTFCLEWNNFDDTFIYTDYRNRIYGIATLKELNTILIMVDMDISF